MTGSRVTTGPKLSLWAKLKRLALTDVGAIARGFKAADIEEMERILLEADLGHGASKPTMVLGVEHEKAAAKSGFTGVVIQLMVINVVFSLDSVITAVGLTDILAVMVLAVILSTVVMAIAAEPLGGFIERHPTTKMLALAFILLVGVALVADGAGFHIPRGYLYFAIAFSLIVELLNIRSRAKPGAA